MKKYERNVRAVGVLYFWKCYDPEISRSVFGVGKIFVGKYLFGKAGSPFETPRSANSLKLADFGS
jgi:hypothetical protein